MLEAELIRCERSTLPSPLLLSPWSRPCLPLPPPPWPCMRVPGAPVPRALLLRLLSHTSQLEAGFSRTLGPWPHRTIRTSPRLPLASGSPLAFLCTQGPSASRPSNWIFNLQSRLVQTFEVEQRLDLPSPFSLLPLPSCSPLADLIPPPPFPPPHWPWAPVPGTPAPRASRSRLLGRTSQLKAGFPLGHIAAAFPLASSFPLAFPCTPGFQ
jgi:hypothetical protein